MNMNYEEYIDSYQQKDRDFLKKYLVLKYFPNYREVPLRHMEITLRYRDNLFLKYLFLPKSIYRTYRIYISLNNESEKQVIDFKNKEEIKKILAVINNCDFE